MTNLRATTKGPRSRRTLILTGGLLLLSLAVAAAGTSFVGDLPVDIGLDLSGEVSRTPVLVLGAEAQGGREPLSMGMTRAPAAESFGQFKLEATGRRNPEARSSEVWLVGFKNPESLVQSPPGSWIVRDGSLVSVPERQPSTLSWKGIGAVDLRFVSHAWSGVVELQQPEREAIDLYAAEGTSRSVRIEPTKVTRFHVQVPRRALDGTAAIVLDDVHPDRLNRLYVGTLIPRVFHTLPKLKRPAFGSVQLGWRPELVGSRLVLDAAAPIERGGVSTFLALWSLTAVLLGAAAAALIAGVRLLQKLRSEPPPPRRLAAFSWRAWILFALPLAAVFTVWWLSFYPGLVSIDTAVQWTQISEGVFNDHHPAFHTLTLKLLRALWDSPAVVILVQIVLLSATLAYAFTSLLRFGVPRWAVGLAFVVTLVSPQFGHMAIALVKDTPYALVLFWITLLLAERLLGSEPKSEHRSWIVIGALLALATLFRHNGILVTVGMVVLLPFFFWKQRRGAVLAGISAVVLLMGTRVGLYQAFDVQGRNFTHRATTFAWHIGAMVEQDVPLAQEEFEFLDQIRKFDAKRWHYSPTSVASTIWGDPNAQLDFPFADAELTRLTALHNELLLRYPALFVRHLLRANAYLFWPPRPADTTEIVDLTFFLPANSSPLERMRKIGHPMAPLLPEGKDTIKKLLRPTLHRQATGGWILWRPALYMYLSILAGFLAVRRTGDWRLLILLGPVLLNTASLAFGVAQEARFQFPVFLSMGFLCALAAIPRREARGIADAVPVPARDTDESRSAAVVQSAG